MNHLFFAISWRQKINILTVFQISGNTGSLGIFEISLDKINKRFILYNKIGRRR